MTTLLLRHSPPLAHARRLTGHSHLACLHLLTYAALRGRTSLAVAWRRRIATFRHR